MFTESKIIEGQEKYVLIVKDEKCEHCKGSGKVKKSITGAHVTNLSVFDNLLKRKILGYLNGHKIIDTGEVDKSLGYDVLIKE